MSLRNLVSKEIIFLQNKYKTNLLLNSENINNLIDSVLKREWGVGCEEKEVFNFKNSVAFIASSHLLAFEQVFMAKFYDFLLNFNDFR